MSTIPMITLVTVDLFIIHFFMAKMIIKKRNTLIILSATNCLRLLFSLVLSNLFQLGNTEIYFFIVFFSPMIWIAEFYILYRLCESYFPPLLIIITNLAILQLSLLFLDFSLFVETTSKLSSNPFVFTQPLILSVFLFISYRINLKYKILLHLFNLKKKYKVFSLISFFYFIILFICHSLTTRTISEINEYIYTSLLIYISLIFLYILLSNNIRQTEQNEQFRLQIKKAFYTDEQMKLTQEFRHDYKAILINISDSLNRKDLQQAKQQLNEILGYSKRVLNSNYYDQLIRLRLPTIQSLLFNFLQSCEKNDINVDLTIKQQIDDVTINIIDLSRCISILCNNAFEAVLDSSSGRIKITIDSSDKEFTFSIENTIINTVNLKEVLKRGHSTKKEHQGYGLYIFTKLLRQYKNTQYYFNIEDNHFIASFSIEKS